MVERHDADAPQLRPDGDNAHDLTKPIRVTLGSVAFPALQPAAASVDFSPDLAPPDLAPAPADVAPARTRRSPRTPRTPRKNG